MLHEMIYLLGYLLALGAVLVFFAGAKSVSYTPAEEQADYDLQYQDLNSVE